MTWSTTTGTGYHLINQKKIERIALPGETSFTYRDDIGPGRNYLLAVHTMAADGSTGPPTVLLHRTAGNDGTNVNAAANPTLAFDSTASEIAVNWPNVAGNAGYTIFVDGQPRSDSPLAANQNSFAMTGLQPNTYYLVEVQTLMNSDDGNSERIAVLAKTAAS